VLLLGLNLESILRRQFSAEWRWRCHLYLFTVAPLD